MKKLLLTVFAATAAITMYATPTLVWQKSVENIFVADSKANELPYSAPVAIDNAGALIATGSYSQDVTIEGKELEAVGTSSYIVKYNAEGNADWVVGLVGSVTINYLVTDKDNNIYVAGQFADEVLFGTTSGDEVVKTGMTFEGDATVEQNAAFLAKYTASGNLVNVRTFVPEVQPELVSVLADPDAMPFYWYSDGDVAFKITDLRVDGDNIYVATVYTGITKVEDLTFDASYVNFIFFMYCDNMCAAVFTLDNDLNNPKIVDQITSSVNDGEYADYTYEVWSAKFDVKGSNMVTAYTGVGALNYQGEVLDLLVNDEDEEIPMFIFSTFKDGKFIAKQITEAAIPFINSNNAVAGVNILNGNGYVSGHKYNVATDEIPSKEIFVATIPSLIPANTSFVTCSALKGDLSYQAQASVITENGDIYIPTHSYYEKPVTGHKINELAGGGITFKFSAESLTESDFEAADMAVAKTSIAVSNINVNGASFSLYNDPDAAGIDDITVDGSDAPAEYFNLQGVKVSNPENGLYIVRQGKTVTKQVIR